MLDPKKTTISHPRSIDSCELIGFGEDQDLFCKARRDENIGGTY